MSLLITGGSIQTRLTKAQKTAPNAIVVNPTGVEDIRELKKVVALGQSVIIESAQNLTEEAQNALLKILEEPPEKTTITLLAENEDQLLPTVVSRCFVSNLSDLRGLSDLSDSDKKILDWMEAGDFASGSHWAETVKDREEATTTINNLLIYLQETTSLEAATIRKLFKAKKYLKANTNIRLTLENLFLKE